MQEDNNMVTEDSDKMFYEMYHKKKENMNLEKDLKFAKKLHEKDGAVDNFVKGSKDSIARPRKKI